MTSLKSARNDIVETLELNGIKAVGYDEKNIIPPVAIVIPDDNYILQPNAKIKMKQWNVGISILLIASRGTEKRNADELDDLIEKTVVVLSEYLDIENVTGPTLVKLSGNNYFGSVVSIQHQFEMEGSN